MYILREIILEVIKSKLVVQTCLALYTVTRTPRLFR